MFFARFFRFLTACMVISALAACVSRPTAPPLERTEAVKARVNLALAYLEQHDFPKAKENIDKAIQHDPQDYLPYSVLAYYYQQIGDSPNADNAYQTAIVLSQARPDVLNNYGTFLCRSGQFEQAFGRFEQALESEQPYYHQADTLENIALCALSAKDSTAFQQALVRLEKLDNARAARLRSLR